MSRAQPLAALSGLHLPLLVLFITLAVSIGTGLQIDTLYEEAYQSLERAKQQRQSLLLAAQRAAAEREQALQLSKRVTEIEATGLLAEPRRLNWVETLDQIRRQQRLDRIDYEISPQSPLPNDFFPAPLQNWSAHKSPMRMRFHALHEGDLFDVLDTLRRTNQPWMQIDSCSLSRPASAGAPAAGLLAECAISWVHLKAKK